MSIQIKHSILFVALFIFSLFSVGQQSNFELDKPLHHHVSESLLDGMDSLSNQIELIYAKPDSLGKGFTFSKYGRQHYFYPASIVKLPVLLLALEWINTLDNPSVTENSPFIFNSQFSCIPKKSNSAYPVDLTTISNCIRKILLVSDNNSYNNLFHLLGRSYIQKELKEKGFAHTQVSKSFVGCEFDEHNNLPGLSFIMNNRDTLVLRNDSTIIYKYDSVENEQITLNKFYRKGKLTYDTLDFIDNNNLPLEEGLEMLMRLIKPEKFPPAKRWNITPEQRDFVMKYMSMYPRESKLKRYANYEDYPDSYKKYFMYGFLKKERINDPIRIYNIVGLACGFTIDIAYIENQKNKDGYFLAAAMFTNENGKYYNGNTNYRKQAFPFFTKLGWSIYKDVYDK
jgi:hypothetical protein